MAQGNPNDSGAAAAGKVALITGGSRGIGLAIARALAGSGAKVVITGRDAATLEKAAAELKASGPAHAVQADIANPDEAARAVDEASTVFGGLDILVNNAGTGTFANVDTLAMDDWNRMIGTNLSGIFHCCRAAIPALRARGGGWIISIGSLSSTQPFAGGAAYCATKAAVTAFSDAMMQELRPANIRVSCVLPGSVATGFGGRHTGADWKLQPEDVARAVIDLIGFPPRSLPSRLELRPSRPAK
jgi:3-oxoacyl-[acyl-carrier protein] reductase